MPTVPIVPIYVYIGTFLIPDVFAQAGLDRNKTQAASSLGTNHFKGLSQAWLTATLLIIDPIPFMAYMFTCSDVLMLPSLCIGPYWSSPVSSL
jgi:hypothetical protein